MYESSYAPMLMTVADDMAEVRKRILAGAMSAEDGIAVAKAGHTAVKSAEVDLHARVFASRLHAVGEMARLADNDQNLIAASAA